MKFTSVRVPVAAVQEANRLKEQLRRRGTDVLPARLRPPGDINNALIFELGVSCLRLLLRGDGKLRMG
jgi:hypothetical protein